MEVDEISKRINEITVSEGLHRLYVHYKKHESDEDLDPRQAQHVAFLALRCKAMYEVMSAPDGTCKESGSATVVDLLRGFALIANHHPNSGGALLYKELYDTLTQVLSDLLGIGIGVSGDFVELGLIKRTQKIWMDFVVFATAAAKENQHPGGGVARGEIIMAANQKAALAMITRQIVVQSLGELAVLIECIGVREAPDGVVQ